PPHWQTAAVLLGCWSAGLQEVMPGTDAPGAVDVLFAAADRIDEAARWPAADRYALPLTPLAAPQRALPAGFADYGVEVRGHGDHIGGSPGAGPQDAQLCGRATQRAAELGLSQGARVLFDADRHPDPVDWLLAPLAAGASVVLCGRLDRARL